MPQPVPASVAPSSHRVRFSLRLKVLLALGGAGLGLGLLLWAGLPGLIVDRFDRQEAERMQLDTRRAALAVEQEVQQLSTFMLNWTVWDETYRYVQRPTRAYEQVNLGPPTFESAGVNLFVYYTPQQRVVSAWAYDLERRRFVSAAPLLAGVARFSGLLLALPRLDSERSGLALLAGDPWLLAARPVVTGAGTGPAAGLMVMGKRLTPAALAEIQRDPRLTFRIGPAAGTVPAAVAPAASPSGTAPAERPILVQALSEERLEGRTLLPDLRGQPSLLLRVEGDRVDHANGVAAARTLLLTALTLALLFTGLTLALVEWLVLGRLALYRQRVQGLRAGEPLAGRLPVRDRDQDELDALGDAMNRLLDRTEEHQRRLRRQATQDELTGLPNRRRFQERLDTLLRGDAPFAVVLIDLNDFKTINDTLGHEVGDEVLRGVAGRLVGALTLKRQELVARLGGDEFVLLLPGSLPAVALRRTREVLASLGPPLPTSAGELFVRASAGISTWPDGQDASALLRHADLAMYHAKASGTETELYSATLSEEARLRADVERDLRGVLDRQELSLMYQPVLDLHSGEVVGGEALLRWTRPGPGGAPLAVPPSVFVPVAEDTGLIVGIGAWVLRAACTQAEAWRQAGRPLRIAVNVSAVQLRQEQFAEEVTGILASCGLPARLLELEVTETAVLPDLPAAMRQLGQLRALGVTVALDDFGTGYASLELLRELPLDKLKLDRSFLCGAEADRRRQTILASVIGLAGQLGLQVVAEGVETPQQAALLHEWRCSLAQGYLYARPLTPQDFWAFAASAPRLPQAR